MFGGWSQISGLLRNIEDDSVMEAYNENNKANLEFDLRADTSWNFS